MSAKCSVSVLLDLSTALTTIDQSLVTERPRRWVGVSGGALDRFSTYLSDKIRRVCLCHLVPSHL